MRQGAGAGVSLLRMPKPRAVIGPRCLGAGAGGGGRPGANGNGGRGGCGALAAAGARASGGGRLRAALREVPRRRQKGGGEGGDSRGRPAAGVSGARPLSVPAEPCGTAGEREGNGAAKEAAVDLSGSRWPTVARQQQKRIEGTGRWRMPKPPGSAMGAALRKAREGELCRRRNFSLSVAEKTEQSHIKAVLEKYLLFVIPVLEQPHVLLKVVVVRVRDPQAVPRPQDGCW
ncbi:AT-rich interactive domain-containing protein 1B-like [Columba livia]|uniref:AT-rich interactive domain-containing protein 1B-like n=1 Tax=Columba livia TaxID=8932 RepID=UPI0031BAC817